MKQVFFFWEIKQAFFFWEMEQAFFFERWSKQAFVFWEKEQFFFFSERWSRLFFLRDEADFFFLKKWSFLNFENFYYVSSWNTTKSTKNFKLFFLVMSVRTMLFLRKMTKAVCWRCCNLILFFLVFAPIEGSKYDFWGLWWKRYKKFVQFSRHF